MNRRDPAYLRLVNGLRVRFPTKVSPDEVCKYIGNHGSVCLMLFGVDVGVLARDVALAERPQWSAVWQYPEGESWAIGGVGYGATPRAASHDAVRVPGRGRLRLKRISGEAKG